LNSFTATARSADRFAASSFREIAMSEFWNSLTGLEKFFVICALASGFLFIVRIAMQIIGFGGDGDMDLDADVDIDDLAHGHGDVGFHLITMQGMTGFFLIFGLVGLALTKQGQWSEGWAVLGGFAAGVVMLVVVAKLTEMMMRLQSSGNISIRNAIGKQGTVYARIPDNGVGQVQVTVQDRLRLYDAMTENKEALDTGEQVEVVGVVSENTLIVKKLM
jgi:membrane protein implicated in regulation of membrane protease activity